MELKERFNWKDVGRGIAYVNPLHGVESKWGGDRGLKAFMNPLHGVERWIIPILQGAVELVNTESITWS